MSFYVAEEEQFVKKTSSIKEDALRNYKVTLYRFLNVREVELVKYICGNDVYVYQSMITNDDEYKRIIVSPFEIEPDFKISILKLEYNKKYLKVNHRMILGALMSYGISRDTIGDIFITTDLDVYIVCSKEISKYLIQELRVLSHQSVELVEVDKIIGQIKKDYDILETFVASLRLDLIISSRFNLSRRVAQEIIKNYEVKVNQKPIDNPCHQLKEGDTISVKGYGRMKILGIGGLSKNNNIYVRLAKLL